MEEVAEKDPKVNSQPQFEIQTSRQLASWLSTYNSSILFSTYQVGKVFMLGLNPDQSLHVTERTFPRCMGLGVKEGADTFWMSSLYQVWRFENSLAKRDRFKDYDRVYIPQMAYTTGDLDIHDIIIDKNGNPIFVNTLFGCLATVSETHSFKPIWKPKFISKLVPEDRCHLNGLAERNGEPAFVTAVSKTDVADGWREHRKNGGVVIDVQQDEVVCDELSMPHSPRWHAGKLYVLEAGTGYFGHIDMKTGEFVKMVFCPGFLRGMDFIGNYAIIGTSALRDNRTFSGLELENSLQDAGVEARCGIHIVNLETGAIENWIRMEGIVAEIYDVKALSDTRKPLIIGTKKDEIKTMLSIENE